MTVIDYCMNENNNDSYSCGGELYYKSQQPFSALIIFSMMITILYFTKYVFHSFRYCDKTKKSTILNSVQAKRTSFSEAIGINQKAPALPILRLILEIPKYLPKSLKNVLLDV